MTQSDSNKIVVHIDSAEQDPTIPPNGEMCPDHPNEPPEVGYGMAGGGMGVYTYCGVCGRMLGKDQDKEGMVDED